MRLTPSSPWALTALLAAGLALAGAPASTAGPSPVPAPASPDASASRTDVGLEERLGQAAPRLDRRVLRRALDATACAAAQGLSRRDDVLTVIDYSLASTTPRLWVFDLERGTLLWEELVAHGKNTGDNYARRFSNVEGSKQSSVGLFRTGETYWGKNGYSLKLHGLEKGVNDLALPRTIVIHGAPYVSQAFARQHGRLGRSWGCPALTQEAATPVIDRIKNGSLVFVDYPEQTWLASSSFLAGGCGGGGGGTTTALAAR